MTHEKRAAFCWHSAHVWLLSACQTARLGLAAYLDMGSTDLTSPLVLTLPALMSSLIASTILSAVLGPKSAACGACTGAMIRHGLYGPIVNLEKKRKEELSLHAVYNIAAQSLGLAAWQDVM